MSLLLEKRNKEIIHRLIVEAIHIHTYNSQIYMADSE